MDRLADAPVRVGANALPDDERRVGEPGRVLERAAVAEHDDEGGDRREPARAGHPGQDLVGQEGALGVARRPAHQVGLRGLALEGDRGREVDEQLHPQDLERDQDRALGHDDRRDENEAQERDVRRQQEDEALLDVVDDPAALGQAVHQGRERVVAEDQVGRLAGDRRAAAHRDRDVGAVERGGVVHPVAGDGDDPVLRSRRADEALLPLRRRSGDDVQVGQLGGQARVVPRRDLLAGHDPVGLETRLAGDRRGRPGVVAGDHHDLDPGTPRGRHRIVDPGPDRVREADERAHPPRLVVDPPGEGDEPLPGVRRRLDQDGPALALERIGPAVGLDVGKDDLGRAEAEALDPPLAPGAGPRHRERVRRRDRLDEVGRVEARHAVELLDGGPEGTGERRRGDLLPGPRVLLGPERLFEEAAALGRVVDGSVGRADRRDPETVLGDRPGLVGDDQIDGAERLLGVQPANEDAALRSR